MTSIYVIAAHEGGPCKIGMANNPASRLADLQYGNPYLLKVFASVECGDAPGAEAWAHRQFSEKRLVGEWFDVSTEQATAAIIAAAAEFLTPRPPRDFAALDQAVSIIGSQMALAGLLGVTRAALNQWALPGRRIPLKHCPTIERLTERAVRCEDLRPDINWHVVRKQVIQ